MYLDQPACIQVVQFVETYIRVFGGEVHKSNDIFLLIYSVMTQCFSLNLYQIVIAQHFTFMCIFFRDNISYYLILHVLVFIL